MINHFINSFLFSLQYAIHFEFYKNIQKYATTIEICGNMHKKFTRKFKLLCFASITEENPKMWKEKNIHLHRNPRFNNKKANTLIAARIFVIIFVRRRCSMYACAYRVDRDSSVCVMNETFARITRTRFAIIDTLLLRSVRILRRTVYY